MAKKRSLIRVEKGFSIELRGKVPRSKELVYVILNDKLVKYPHRKSRIVYIGMTQNGIARVGSSLARKANDKWAESEAKRPRAVLKAQVITCTDPKHTHEMEAALLLSFRERYGTKPKYNGQIRREFTEDHLFKKCFRRIRIINVLEELGE